MTTADGKHIFVVESTPNYLSSDLFAVEDERWLGRWYGHVLDIVPPSFQTDQQWRLFVRGWVGQIPLPDGRLLVLTPKIPLHKLFAMLARVYGLVPFKFLSGAYAGQTIPEFYEFLASALLDGVQALLRGGIVRTYEDRRGRPSSIRGRLDMKSVMADPTAVLPLSDYQLYTADNPHNQLLAWTLVQMGSALFNSPQIARQARFVARRLPVTLRPFTVAEATALTYDRLTRDYEPLHRLCRFFLAQIGPTPAAGSRRLTPFLVSMPRLFERFVGRWIADHLPAGWRLVEQAPIPLQQSMGNPRRLAADLVLIDPQGSAAAVLDIKYKADEDPAMEDIYQVTFYAHQLGCNQAILVYPAALKNEVRGRNRGVDYRSLAFDISGDHDLAGRRLLEQILGPSLIVN